MRKLRDGTIGRDEIILINSRNIANSDVQLPSIDNLRYACFSNRERNAISARIFLKHLDATHECSMNMNVECPKHTCIIKATMRYKANCTTMIATSLQNLIYDTVGDADMENEDKKKVDPVIKFYYEKPLMITSNGRIKENLANGTPFMGMYVKLNEGEKFKKENWEGFMVNTIFAHQVEYMICGREKEKDEDPDEFFKFFPETRSVKLSLPTLGNYKLKGIHVTQFEVNDNVATTCHKLQGASLDQIIVHSWNYTIINWVYVVLSRVKKLAGLLLCESLDETHDFSCDPSLQTWENNMKDRLEKPLFEMRGEYDDYVEDEDLYS